MPTLTRPPTEVKMSKRFRQNYTACLAAGWILKCGLAEVYVGGIPVDRDLFEEASSPEALVAILKHRIGNPKRYKTVLIEEEI